MTAQGERVSPPSRHPGVVRQHYPARHAKRSRRPPGSGGRQTLDSKVKSGVLWSALNTIILRVANFCVTALLARTVFGPQAFGIYAVSQVILNLLLSANEAGVSLAIVRWEGDIRRFVRTVCTLSLASSTALYILLFATAPALARSLGSPQAVGMIRIICLGVVIDGLACVPLALITRAFAQRTMFVVQALSFLAATGITLWLAFSGLGPISFAWGSVAGCMVTFVAAVIAAPFRVLPGWNSQYARKLLRFGLPLAGASLLLLGVYNIDSIVVGAALGPAALGLYALAFNVSSWPVRATSEAIRRVSFASFSRIADSPGSLTSGFARAIGLAVAVAVPSCVYLGTLAKPLIQLIYGERWIPAAPVLTLLCALGLLRVLYEISYDCLAAAGRRSSLLAIQGWWLAALFPVLFAGAHLRGIVGVGIGHVAVAGVLVGPAFIWSLWRSGIRLRTVIAVCARPLAGGIAMVAVCEFALHALGQPLLQVCAAIVAGALVYVPIVFPVRHLLRAQPESKSHEESSI